MGHANEPLQRKQRRRKRCTFEKVDEAGVVMIDLAQVSAVFEVRHSRLMCRYIPW